ncbi:transposase, partial [Lactobacillus sp. XV13L]|nr:transposase [Lactobacillus sp. XV13L]
GLESSLSRSFPQAQLQQCLVHVSRNLEHHVRLKDRRAVLADFQQIHQAPNKAEALVALQSFIQT